MVAKDVAVVVVGQDDQKSLEVLLLVAKDVVATVVAVAVAGCWRRPKETGREDRNRLEEKTEADVIVAVVNCLFLVVAIVGCCYCCIDNTLVCVQVLALLLSSILLYAYGTGRFTVEFTSKT